MKIRPENVALVLIWGFYAFVVIEIVMLVMSLPGNCIDIKIDTDTNINIESQGLSFTDTLTINGQPWNGIHEYMDNGSLVRDYWTEGMLWHREYLEIDNTTHGWFAD